MKKEFITIDKVKNTPAGGVLIGKDKEGQTIIPEDGSLGGFLIGKLHKEGGIEAVNKSNGQALEMQSNEVVITAPAVADTTKREFEGKMMTNREILSKINSDGGGVKLEGGGATGNGHISKNKSFKQIAKMHKVPVKKIMEQAMIGFEVEAEHTSDNAEQMKIIKDHLVENPKYYTLLKKVGLAKGGLIAPNGKTSNLNAVQYKLVRTPEFKAWFGNWESNPNDASKVVDENGEPLVVYHGTKNDFYQFDTEKQRIGWLGKGFYFTKDKTFAKDFGKRVLKVFLNIRNPFIIKGDLVNDDGTVTWGIGREGEIKAKYGNVNASDISTTLKEFENDGIIEGDMLNCFYSNQIKLADGSNKTFGVNTNDIRYKKGGQVKEDLAKDSDKGDTPARDLNNYNDLLDMQADGEVGGDTGLAMAYGGDLSELDSHFDLGGNVGMPKIEYVKIQSVGNSAHQDFIGKEFKSYIDLADSLTKMFVDNEKRMGYFYFTINDTKDRFALQFKNAKNTVLNFNPVTGSYKDFEKQIERRFPRSAKKYDWDNWLLGRVSAMPAPTAKAVVTAQTNSAIVSNIANDNVVAFSTVNIPSSSWTNSDKWNFLTSVRSALMESIDNIDFLKNVPEIQFFNKHKEPLCEPISVAERKTGQDYFAPAIFVINKDTSETDFLLGVFSAFPELDFKLVLDSMETILYEKFLADSKNTTTTQSGSSKFSQGELQMFEEVYEYAKGNNLTVMDMQFVSSFSTRDLTFTNKETKESYNILQFENALGSLKDNRGSENFIKKYLEWEKEGRPSAVVSTKTVQNEIPDEINRFSGKVSDLPKPILDLAIKRGAEQGISAESFETQALLADIIDVSSGNMFIFDQTPEGLDFWMEIARGDFKAFKEKFGKYGELVDATVDTGIAKAITDDFLKNTKIWIGNNPDLSKAVQEKAFELGFQWFSGDKKALNLNENALYFNEKNIITSGSKADFFETNSKREIFASDLFDMAPTTDNSINVSAIKDVPRQSTSNEFVADDFELRKNALLSDDGLQQDRDDLEDLAKLLPAFQEIKFANEKSAILKEMDRLQKKITYSGFIGLNEKVSKGKDLFTPQGLLHYYYTQTTQNPTAEMEPACELPTPNGEKSKLPMSAYLNVRSSQFKKWFGDWEKAYETGNYVDCSKMIDEETKEPKIFYHGVRKYIPSFGQFSNMGSGVVRPYGSFEPPNFPASYFADNEGYANFYGGIAENMPKPSPDYKPFIYKVFLCAKNPISLLPLDFEISYRDLIDYVLVAYGIRISENKSLLSEIGGDINRKNPMWVYIRKDIGLIETLKGFGYDALIQQGDIPAFDRNGEVVSDRSKFIKDTEYLTFYPTQVKSATVKKSFYFNFFNDIRFKDGGYVCI